MTQHIYETKLTDFTVGQRVELHPGCDMWMRGARFGEVIAVGRKFVHVKLDNARGTFMGVPNRLRIISAALLAVALLALASQAEARGSGGHGFSHGGGHHGWSHSNGGRHR